MSSFLRRLAFASRWRARRRARLVELWRQPISPAWSLDLLFALLDYSGVTDFYEACTTAFSGARPLTPRERNLLLPYFGHSIPYDLIRIDERARLGPKSHRICYVSFHTINSWGPMPDHVLVHEVVHVWQYTHRGAAYIPRALYAQTTPMGYNYGGLDRLDAAYELEDFNYEQQADIIEDAYRLANGYQAQWVPGRGAEVLPYYQPYLAEVRRYEYSRW